jgi:hypothetical protein
MYISTLHNGTSDAFYVVYRDSTIADSTFRFSTWDYGEPDQRTYEVLIVDSSLFVKSGKGYLRVLDPSADTCIYTNENLHLLSLDEQFCYEGMDEAGAWKYQRTARKEVHIDDQCCPFYIYNKEYILLSYSIACGCMLPFESFEMVKLDTLVLAPASK